ncbi:MAG: holo-ACP synthase [Lentisphaeria bacterium]|nr:holo-ACP synthase [Lentisphaeria bacterium]
MDIVGLGTDIVELRRIEAVMTRFARQFRERIYTPAELALAESKNNHIAYFAGRWAAKEAVSKALGCGIGEACAFTDIEILNDEKGRPVMTLANAAKRTAAALNVDSIKISISHENKYAVATVILCSKES